jgi:4-amino-4-deoxy-L-arabinose transferase-like glycosyltransferase
MKKANALSNPYLLFSPFLILYILWVFVSPSNGTSGDESRYLGYANNLIHGYYSLPAPNIELINGPGYPIVLIPFLLLKLPLISLTLMNAFFYYFSIILLFKALKEIVSYRVALAFSLVWASYYIAFQSIPFIHTETFIYVLISALTLSSVKAFRHDSPGNEKKYIFLTGFIFGYIVLTKIIFAYVLLIMITGGCLLWILNKKNLNYRKAVVILLVALATTLPYLIYTYNLTGRIFYWGSQNDSLYWMSNPDKNEYGSWFPDQELESEVSYFTYYIPSCKDSIIYHHGKELQEVHNLKGLEKDDAYKKLAINNIKEHPLKYFKNIIYNSSRLFFQYPFSYGIHRPKVLIIFPLNGIILTLMLFSLVPTMLNWRKIPVSIRFLLLIILIYLGGSLLVPAQVRMLSIVIPIVLLWIAFIFQNSLKINLKL